MVVKHIIVGMLLQQLVMYQQSVEMMMAFNSHFESFAHQHFLKFVEFHCELQMNKMHHMILLYLQEKNSQDQHTVSKCTHKHFVKNLSFFTWKKQKCPKHNTIEEERQLAH